MLLLYLLFVLVVLLVVLDRRRFNKLTSKHGQTLTDHPYVPFLRHSCMFMGNSADLMNCLKELAYRGHKNTDGAVTFCVGDILYASISDAEAAKLVAKSCLDKGHLTRLMRQLVGNGSIFAPVDIWRPRRKILAQAMAPKYVKNYFDLFVRSSHTVVEALESVTGKGDFTVWKYISPFSLGSACESVYGVNFQFQKNLNHPFFNAFGEYLKNLGARILQIWLQPDAIYKLLPVYKTQSDMKDILHKFSEDLISEHKRELRAHKQESDTADVKHTNIKKVQNTLLQLLIKFSGSTKEYTDVELREETLVLLLAATDTLASSACFTLLLLSQYPDEQDKVYKEINDIFGDTNSNISINDLPKLTYLEAFIKESLRLYPAGPGIVRKCDSDLELPSGSVMCENTLFIINIWGVHRNPRYWGADADQFRPERFLSATPEQLSAFMPFSYGSRNCVGNVYAMIALKVLLVTILRQYVIKPATSYTYDKDKGFRVKFDLMMKHVDKFNIQIERRA